VYFKAPALYGALNLSDFRKTLSWAAERLLQRKVMCQLLSVNMMSLKIHVDGARTASFSAICRPTTSAVLAVAGAGLPFSSQVQFAFYLALAW
jgi:hypothetical protein